MVTPDGLPVAYEVYPSNTHEASTLEEFLDQVENRWGRARRTWLMDRGLSAACSLYRNLLRVHRRNTIENRLGDPGESSSELILGRRRPSPHLDSRDQGETPVPTYYPGVPNLMEATQIDVPAGAQYTGADMVLQKARHGRRAALRGTWTRRRRQAPGDPCDPELVRGVPRPRIGLSPLKRTT